jgi:hypothetical protein
LVFSLPYFSFCDDIFFVAFLTFFWHGFYCYLLCFPPSACTYTQSLPLFLSCKPKAPVKAALCKVILDTEFPAQPLPELFGDFLYAYQQSGMDVSDILGANAAQAMGFQLFAPIVDLPAAVAAVNANAAAAASDTSRSAMPAASIVGAGTTTATATAAAAPPAVVSILVSKNAGRYRLQADSYTGLFLIMEELERRLNVKIAAGNDPGNAGAALNA